MRPETRGADVGVCNICGNTAKLTEDHIPPKGCPRVGQTYLMNIMELIGTKPEKKSRRFFQNGVKYRSICSNCNNVLLGTYYDPELVNFSYSLKEKIESRLFLPIEITTKLNKVVRSAIGHLIAHGIDLHRKGDDFGLLTDYFLDSSAQWPANLKLYCWPYPSNDQVVIRIAGYVSARTGVPNSIFTLIKFFPVAFLITSDEPPESFFSYSRIDPLLTADIDDEILVTLPISNIPRMRWPEAPDKFGMILHTPYSFGASRN